MTGRISRGQPRVLITLTALALVAGCAREASYVAPAFPFLQNYAHRQDGAPVLLDNAAWWAAFRDPVLDDLVMRALRDSVTLEVARQRVREAEANVGQIPGAANLTPEVAITREGRRGGPHQTSSEATLGLSWLLDPYGSRRSQIKAARARVEATDAETDAARLLLLLNVTSAYVDLRYRQRLLEVRQQEARARARTLDLTRRLFDQNSATRLDVVRAEARLAETQAAIPTVRAAEQGQKYRIAVLLGATPGTLDIKFGGGGQPRPAMAPDTGIPADLLRNRPDIRIAERLYYAALADLGAARADLYPKLSLSGAISLTSLRGVEGMEYYIGPSLRLPALPGSNRRAAVEARDARVRQAHGAWTTTVLDAILEVETSMLDYSGARASVGAAQKAVGLYREAVSLTEDLVSRDAATIRDLLDADEAVADAELVLAENRRQMAQSFIRLNVGLGSGNAFQKGADAPPTE